MWFTLVPRNRVWLKICQDHSIRAVSPLFYNEKGLKTAYSKHRQL
jgi:hypothetical protein